jgi:PLP dependent protein
VSAGRSPAERQAELATRLAATRARIEAACAAAGRQPDEVTLIAVTKTYPASDVLALAGLGLTDFGENRDQEAAAKAAAVPPGPGVTWHFIGQLQSNKVHSVVQYASVVHSVDRARLIGHLGRAAMSRPGANLVERSDVVCLIQVSLDDNPSRGGAPAGQVADLARQIQDEPGLQLGGVMAVAPLGADPFAAFAPLRQLSHTVRSVNPGAAIISAGMSGDLEAAVASGATHLRIGTALLGDRRLPFR